MAFLEIVHLTGDSDKRPLTKTSSLSIGSHRSNDIQIDEDTVELMHCRISWSKNGYEVVAAGTRPLEINGNSVQRAVLKGGDILRLGTVDIKFRDKDGAAATEEAAQPEDDLGLKPITGDFLAFKDIPKAKPVLPPGSTAPAKTPAAPRSGEAPKSRASDAAKTRPVDKPVEKPQEPPVKKKSASSADDEPGLKFGFGAALDALAQESQSEIVLPKGALESPKPVREKKKEPPTARPSQPSPPAKAPVAAPRKDDAPPLDFSQLPSDAEMAAPLESPATSTVAASSDPEEALSARLRRTLRGEDRRPGDEDPIRHPLVLGLAGLAAVLTLAGLLFYFIAGRQTTQAAFDVAKGLYEEGNFLTAIPELEAFIEAHPDNDLSIEARRLLGYARIRQQVEGASPNFAKGIEGIREFINEQRDVEGFETIHSNLAEMAKTTSLGAAALAGKIFDPALLTISTEARSILKTYSPQDAPPTETLLKIEDTIRKSQAAILKESVYTKFVADIDRQLAEKRPLKALQLRRDLLTQYSEFERDRKIVAATQQMLTLEQSLCVANNDDRPALTEDHPVPPGSLSLLFQGRTRTDEVPVDQCVVAVAKDCVYGLEFVTGAPRWRRVCGLNAPFPPITDPTNDAVYFFDTRFQEVIRLHQHTGQLVWRQPLGEPLTGQPLLDSGALYVTTQNASVYSLDTETGNVTSQLKFSQPVTGPVTFVDDSRLFVAGDEEVVYTLNKRPLECTAVTYIGQLAGSIETPLLAMGNYILLIENQGSTARLRLINTQTGDKPLQEIATASVQGRVLNDPAVIRGRDLFVPSTVERVSSFTVSADPGQPPLTAGPVYQGKSAQAGPIHLLTGPERQLWIATGSLAKLRLTTDTLQQEGEPSARGISSQPLQFLSGYLFHGRQRAYTESVTFTRTEREQMASDWQATLGARIIAWSAAPADPNTIVCVNEAGQSFRVGPRQWETGPFLSEAIYRLPLNEDLQDPLLASSLGDGRIAVTAGSPEPRVWIINAAGQSESSPQLPAPPEAAPFRLGKYVLVPCTGRLHAVRFTGQTPLPDFLLPTGEPQHWLSVLPASEDRAIAITSEGMAYSIQLQSSPQLHLGEAAKVDLGQSVLLAPGVGEGLVAIADASLRLSLFDSEQLELRTSRMLEAAPSHPPVIQAGHVFVEVGGNQLLCLSPDDNLPTRWQLPLPDSSLAGLTVINGNVIVALQNGLVQAVHLESGQIVKHFDTQTALANGPVQFGTRLLVGSLDGALIPIHQVLQAE